MSGLFDWIDDELGLLKEQGLHRALRQVAGAPAPEMRAEGRQVIQFASNNYLGLSTHPRVIKAAQDALARFGSGAGASRLINGSQAVTHELEAELARHKGAEAALVFATGSMANLGLLQALAGEGDLIVLDKLDHASLYDGARLSGAEVSRFPHADLGRLGSILQGWTGSGRKFVAVEAVYSMEGDIVDLPALLELCGRQGAALLVDEAHSTGVLGGTGRGILEHYGVKGWPAGLILAGTLSKALASLGGYVAGPRKLIDYLVNRSRPFIFATALPASCSAAALEALRVLEEEPEHLRRLWSNRRQLATGLTGQGWSIGPSQSPILPLLIGSAGGALQLQARLWDAGYFAPAIRPPTVPAGACRLRLSVGAAHQPEQIAAFLQALGAP